MKKVGIRKYEVEEGDFPLQVRVEAKNLASCQAVPSAVQVSKDGVVVDAFAVQVTEHAADLAISYAIPRHHAGPQHDLVQSVDCWFADNRSENSRYEVLIQSALGDEERTTGSAPTINPRNITLTFHHR
jgi:hypothetical protein